MLFLGLTGAPFGFVDGEFDPSVVRQDTPLGVPSQNDENGIVWTDLATLEVLPTGIFDLGNLLPANGLVQSLEDFNAVFPNAELLFAGAGNPNRAPLNFIPAPAQQIPEPGSGGLLMAVGAFLASRRRR